jgi:hypothetical protein
LTHAKSILVTGGAGYIGSHTCKALADKGFQPVAYDNLSRGHRWAVKWGPLELGDIRDKARLEAVMRAYRPLAVLHFAALAYVGESVQDPEITTTMSRQPDPDCQCKVLWHRGLYSLQHLRGLRHSRKNTHRRRSPAKAD